MLVDLRFLDFAVLALVLSVLYLISAVELMWIAGSEHEVKSRKGRDLKTASTWAFLGVISTIFSGIISELNIVRWADLGLAVVPLGFVVQWAIYHREASSVIDFDIIEKRLREAYKTEIISWARRSQRFQDKPFDLAEVVDVLQNANPTAVLASMSTTLGKKFLGVPPEQFVQLFGPIWIRPDKAGELLAELEQSGDLTQHNGDYYLT